jgi:mannose-6-phosphate isomerase class I
MPDVYKDPNPKPEIAIALSDDFMACIGFMSLQNIKVSLKENVPELLEVVNDSENFLRDFCTYLFMDLD